MRQLAPRLLAQQASPGASATGYSGLYANGSGMLSSTDPFGMDGSLPRVFAVKSAQSVVTNTTTEQALMTVTLPAGTPIGSYFQAVVFGNCDCNALTLTMRLRLGGLTGAIIATATITTVSSTAMPWRGQAELICLSIGGSGTWTGSLSILDNFSSSNDNALGSGTGIVQSTLVSNDMTVTAQWSATATKNAIRAFGGYAARLF